VIDSKYLPAFDGWLRTMGEDVLSLANLLETSDAPLPFRQASAQALQYLLRSTELIPEGLEALGYLEGAFAFRVIAQHALDDGPDELSGDASTDDDSTDERPVDGPTGDDLTDEGLTDDDPTDERPVDGPTGDDLTDEGLTDEGLGDDPTDDGFAADRFGHGLTDDDSADPDPRDEGATDDRPRDDGSPQAGAPDDGHRAGSRGVDRADRVELTEGRVPRLAADVELIREFLEDDMPRLLELTLAPAATSRAGRSAADVLVDAALRGVTLRDARQWVERYRAPELRASEQELVKLRSFFRTRLRREA
jgi:hypothetical protein